MKRRLWLTEGVTDTAAALTLGLEIVIGRPSCSAGNTMIYELCKRLRITEVVLLSDNDTAGISGALNTPLPCRSAVVLTPAKDVREFACMGGSAMMLESQLRDVRWEQPA